LATRYALPSDHSVEWALFMAGAELARQQKEPNWPTGLEDAYDKYVVMEARCCIAGQDVVTSWMVRDEAPIAGACKVSAGEVGKIIEERCGALVLLDYKPIHVAHALALVALLRSSAAMQREILKTAFNRNAWMKGVREGAAEGTAVKGLSVN